MNRKMVFYTVGHIIQIEAVLLLLPLLVSVLYRESGVWSFLITAAVAGMIGTVTTLVCRTADRVIFAREGFATVALAWVALSAIGALPFVISGEIPSYVDAFFETVSGFTTTGASILTNVEAMSYGMLFWRSFTHWIGGMGVLVLMMAILPSDSGRSIHIMRAEMPGPIIGKLVPRVRDTAKILYLIYIALTLIQIVFLWCGDMNLFESIVHSLGTAGTGGFGVKSASIGAYSAYSQWVITVFMMLFGINFNLYYLMLIRRFRSIVKSSEIWVYLGLIATAIVSIAVNIAPLYQTLTESIRHAAFQVSSIITTTGYSTTDFALWPEFSQTVLLLLMFIGACAGSTAGGLKVSRVVLLIRMIRRELQYMLHPHSVAVVRNDGKKVDTNTLNSVSVYFALYMLIVAVVFLLLSLESQFDLRTNLSATAACFNNIGPGLGAVGPTGSYAGYSDLSTLLLSGVMLLGRLELYPLLLSLAPTTWSKK